MTSHSECDGAECGGADPVPAISIHGVTKSYGSTEVLRAIDLEIPADSVTAVLGASGSGKTTLLRLIAGFDTVDAGSIRIAGSLVDDGRRRVRTQHRGVGYVPQDAALFPHLTVLANIAFGVARRQRTELGDLIELVGLTGYEHRYPHELSGGQQQRVALARALAIRPDVVLLDEPFGSLDAALRDTVRRDVIGILTDAGTTTVLVTHDQDEALALAQYIALIDDGRVVAGGSPSDLYRRPPTPAVAAAIGLANIVPGRRADGLVHCALGALPTTSDIAAADPGTGCQVLIRPEQLMLSPDARPGTVASRVERVRYHGHDSLLDLLLESSSPAGQIVTLTARTPGKATFEPGQTAHVGVLGAVHLWDGVAR